MKWAAAISTLTILGVAACVHAGMVPGIIGSVVKPMYVAADPGVDAAELEAGVCMWNDAAPIDLFEMHPEMWDDCRDGGCLGVVTVYRAQLAPGTRAVAVLWAPRGEVLTCEIVADDAWPDAGYVYAHELGHCLGLYHSPSSADIMHTPVQPHGRVRASDIDCVLHGCAE